MFYSVERDNLTISIRNGLYMPFMYKGRQIVIHNASWSFREKIWIDDELVVNELGVSMASTHVLDVDGDNLEVTFGYRNRMKELFLEARAGKDLVHELKHTIVKEVKPATLLAYTIGLVLAGVAFGYVASHLVASLIGGA